MPIDELSRLVDNLAEVRFNPNLSESTAEDIDEITDIFMARQNWKRNICVELRRMMGMRKVILEALGMVLIVGIMWVWVILLAALLY
jgi:hypothetical protein